MTNASRAVLGSIALAASLLSSLVRGEEPSYEFDLELLSSELGVTLTSADVERLTQASLAGHHTYDIVVNGVFMQRLGVDISFTPERFRAAFRTVRTRIRGRRRRCASHARRHAFENVAKCDDVALGGL